MKRFRAAALIALAASLLWGAGGRRKLWDLDLSKFVNHQKHMVSQVWGIRFSPDESKVAVGFGPDPYADHSPRHAVVVAVDQPQVALREFELSTTEVIFPSGSTVVWSPSGAILVARFQTPIMFRLDAEAPCVFPKESEFGGFLSQDRMVVFLRRPDLPTEIRILKPDCTLADSWQTTAQHLLDTSPELDSLAVETQLKPPEHSAIELVASRTHEVHQRWIWDLDASSRGGFLFSIQGSLVCSANHREGKRDPDVACWDTQTGAKTAENDKVTVNKWAVQSTGGDLLALTDYKYTWHHSWLKDLLQIDYSMVTSAPRRQLIWNVRTGKEAASWGMEGLQQELLWGTDPRNPRTIKTDFVLSLSPTGRYFAEGGSGSVSAYAVQP